MVGSAMTYEDMVFSLNRRRENATAVASTAASEGAGKRQDSHLGVLVDGVSTLRGERHESPILVRTELEELAVEQVEGSVRRAAVAGKSTDSAIEVNVHAHVLT